MHLLFMLRLLVLCKERLRIRTWREDERANTIALFVTIERYLHQYIVTRLVIHTEPYEGTPTMPSAASCGSPLSHQWS